MHACPAYLLCNPAFSALQVVSFLRSLLADACSAATAAAGSPEAPPGPQAVAAMAVAQPELLQLVLTVLRCFTAWTRLGCLQHLDHQQAGYFASVAGELLFVPDLRHGLPYHTLCLPAAVDAVSEIIEHATEALQPLLAQLVAALPQRAAALSSSGAEDEAAELSHVFEMFCSTHCALCGAEGPDGEALRQVRWGGRHEFRLGTRGCGGCGLRACTPLASHRCRPCHTAGLPDWESSSHAPFSIPNFHACHSRLQGLLQLLALPQRAGSDGGGAALPAMTALGDLLEHLLLHNRSPGTPGAAADGSEQATRLVVGCARLGGSAQVRNVAQCHPLADHPAACNEALNSCLSLRCRLLAGCWASMAGTPLLLLPCKCYWCSWSPSQQLLPCNMLNGQPASLCSVGCAALRAFLMPCAGRQVGTVGSHIMGSHVSVVWLLDACL